MSIKSGYSRATVEANIAQLLREGYQRAQAIAVALNVARKAYLKRHPQGFMPTHLATPEEKSRRRAFKRGTNPVPPSSRSIDQAKDLYERFTGHTAEEIGTIDKPDIPGVLVAIGEIDGVLYTTVRDGQVEKYIHRFKKQARPLFAVSPDGSQLFMLGGAYDFTERGIVDRA